ncbi:HU family DNA-binding protein [Parabacteroides sp. AM08-6]|uniref:HU family DNA-binding protein n=1 Tax=Parabacteroides sp. AM08-6 TaxID=2292053 RepID=UPI000EFFE599|nr:HU family DNA-binding protein [Parabacteroides sp. AM08-6]RHJ83477.1 HU family DNA-binding protein [Parabacteroides sp. AM08-6]
MNNRLTIQDLAGLLAEYTGKDKTNTERFLKEFIAVVTNGVYADKIVKVKGLGTFKIITVEKRESIHVNTGERFLIPEHYKFSFLPDRELKELVNKPFSFFETTELNETTDFSELDVSEETEVKETEDESVEEVMPEEQIEEQLPQPQPEKNAEEEALAMPEQEIAPETIIPEPEQPVNEQEPLPPNPPTTIPKSSVKRNWFIALFLLFLVAMNVFIYLNRHTFLQKKDIEPVTVEEKQTVPVHMPDTATVSVGNQDSITGKSENEIPVAAQSAPDTITVKQTVIGQEKIEPGTHLTLIAQKYYGKKIFWVYIYEYNKAIIKNPNDIPIGTTLEIPAPEIYGINPRDRVSLEKAAALQTEIINREL